MTKTVAILGTLDTKGQEFGYLRICIESAGLGTLLIDCGVLESPEITPDVSRQEIAAAGGFRVESRSLQKLDLCKSESVTEAFSSRRAAPRQ
jgi:uncharacterized protein (UPF0261 family)